MKEMKIKVEDLHFSFGTRKIFDGVSFSIKPNEVTAILGVSGCGKSTLIKLLSGLKKADYGKILYGEDNQDRIDNNDMSIIFQDSTLFPWKTVQKNIELSSKHDVNIEKIAQAIGLLNSLNLYPDQLSRGMKQRVEFGRVIARSPKLLFMDEPFSSLDVQYRDHLQKLFIQIQKSKRPTSLIVTHDIEEAIKVSKYIKVLIGNPVNNVIEYENNFNNEKKVIEDVKIILYKDFNNSN